MGDYIRREDAVDAVKHAWAKGIEPSQYIESLEPADAVQVVRCKDCKHHAYDEIFSSFWCEYPGRAREITPDGFCEKGEE